MYLDSSHGDFVHWNTRVINNTNYSFDLEHFSNERVLFYDLIHWYFIHLFKKIFLNKLDQNIFKILSIYLKKYF